MTTWTHPFEKSGLGKAPFRCVDVVENWYSACAGHKQPGGSCAYCGTGIAYEYVIVGSDGSQFKVGSDCVMRTNAQAPVKNADEIAGFRRQRAKLAREKKAKGFAARRAEREAQWAIDRTNRFAAFSTEEPEICRILDKLLLEADPEAPTSFMLEMAHAIKRFGSLTAGQLAAVKASIARDAEKANSEFVGQPKQRIRGSFEIIATRSWENSYVWPPRTVFWTLMKMNGRDFVTYKGNHLGEKGEKFTAKFTVKEHEIYKNVRQTKLQRPTICEEPSTIPVTDQWGNVLDGKGRRKGA